MVNKKVNILFLDFDDVLNSVRSLYKKFAEAHGVSWAEEDFDPKYWGEGHQDNMNPEFGARVEKAHAEQKNEEGYEFPDLSMENYPHDEIAIQNLNKIIEENKAKVVVCSSWRTGRSIEELQRILDSWGAKCEVIGKTPGKISSTRGEEILMWIRDNQTKVKAICILDDSLFDINPWLEKWAVQKISGYRHGLREEHISEAKKCFETPFNYKTYYKK
jgi:hypothetical protein